MLCNNCNIKPTNETIRTTHRLVTSGTVKQDGTIAQAGQFRTTPYHYGTGNVYFKAFTVPPHLERIVMSTTSHHLAVELLYQ